MKKIRKIIPIKPDKKELPFGPEENTPPETEEENPDSSDPVADTGNPPPTKPAPIKK